MRLRRDAEPYQVKSVILCCREKPLAMFRAARTRNRHRWSGREYQGDGRTVVKELGKLPPHLREKGGRTRDPTCWGSVVWPQRAGGSDCLLKTQVHAKS